MMLSVLFALVNISYLIMKNLAVPTLNANDFVCVIKSGFNTAMHDITLNDHFLLILCNQIMILSAKQFICGM